MIYQFIYISFLNKKEAHLQNYSVRNQQAIQGLSFSKQKYRTLNGCSIRLSNKANFINIVKIGRTIRISLIVSLLSQGFHFLAYLQFIYIMGNQPQVTRRLSKPTRYSRNSYSLDEASMMSRHIENIPSDGNKTPVPLDNIFLSQISQKPPPVLEPLSLPSPTSNETMKRSLTNPTSIDSRKITKQGNDQRLSQLNTKNDKLRKELIRISSELTSKLSKKKYEQKKKEEQPQPDKSIQGIKRQLQNGYKQIARYKKLLEEKRSTDSTNNGEVLNEIQAKLNDIDFQIKESSNQLEAAKNIKKNQERIIKKSEEEMNNTELKELRAEVQKMRNKLRVNHKTERKKEHNSKVIQQYMFQLERKWREMNGEYLPDIKSYANKNFMPDIKIDKKKKDKEEAVNYRPAKWQINDALEQLRSLKEKHQEYHLKMEKALKSKTTVRELYDKLKDDLQNSQKQLDTLKYRRDRYLQLVMGNIDFLMNEQEELEDSGASNEGKNDGLRVIMKGNDVPDQVKFDDHGVITNSTYSDSKIVSINVWYTDKRQISVIQVIYSNGKDCFMGNKTAKVTGDMQKDTLQVDEGDYVKNIMGSFNKKGAIQFLAFNSSKGKAKQFGKEIMNGLNFTFGVTKRERPICISGFTFFDGNYWRINKLIVDVTDL